MFNQPEEVHASTAHKQGGERRSLWKSSKTIFSISLARSAINSDNDIHQRATVYKM